MIRSISTVDQVEPISISSVHSDLLRTHILTRLDGPTLASTSCASSEFYTLSTEENLWRNICNSTWPSTDDPRMQQIIHNFPNGPRSFFSNSFPSLVVPFDRQQSRCHNLNHTSTTMTNNTSGLISAVDIRYNDNLVFSKVHETETVTGWFRCSPFRVDLLDPKDVVPTTIRYQVTNMCQDLQENMTLSWIVVDQSCTGTGSACSNTSIPGTARAANLSSWRPVSVQRHWLTSEIQVRFATILVGDRGGSTEFVQCGIIVTFGGSDMHVREVSLQVEDMDGINLNGKDSLVILQRAIESGERKKGRREEKKERYGEFLRMKRERKERNLRIEGRMDALCVAFGVSIFIAFWIFVMFKL